MKLIFEDLLEKDESLNLLIDFIKGNNCPENNETLENMSNEVVDLPNYIKILLNFIYYALFISDQDITSFYYQIKVNKDCGEMEPKDIIEIFFKTFLNTALGNQITLGYYLEDSNKIDGDLKNLFWYSEKLKEYEKYKIQVTSHFFGSSKATSDVYLLEYLYLTLYFSLNNIFHFYNCLSKLVHNEN
ncbi:hypothetical protein NBO_175g0001 [Nosema bombycis CQ1]|uniref:Uncharacterized protein n=1 Tax=Nosema bombycis (strain CQ1 / CVCC 102059) TaxID=578461 RepID=R0MG47_NOSB1|nr:hypothetical protein NBO_175g0001 [Nosema bombycis CQ1]|eukprot:EOB13110.1 hypothetical protein NBO_175g0001 [Nosema bombycis CQ1]